MRDETFQLLVSEGILPLGGSQGTRLCALSGFLHSRRLPSIVIRADIRILIILSFFYEPLLINILNTKRFDDSNKTSLIELCEVEVIRWVFKPTAR